MACCALGGRHCRRCPAGRTQRLGLQGNRAIELRQQQAKQVLQTTFPHVPVIIDAPVQMQRELDLLRSNSGALSANDLEALLAASAGRACKVTEGLQYQDQQLRISELDLSPATERRAQIYPGQRLSAATRRSRTGARRQRLAMKQKNALKAALAPLGQRWSALARREQNLLLLAASVVLLALLWWLALAPAVHSLRTAPARHAAAELELRNMLQVQAQAELRQQPQSNSADARMQLEQSLKTELGSSAQLRWRNRADQPDPDRRAGTGPLAGSGARQQPSVAEMKLNRILGEGADGAAITRWSGNLLLELPGNAGAPGWPGHEPVPVTPRQPSPAQTARGGRSRSPRPWAWAVPCWALAGGAGPGAAAWLAAARSVSANQFTAGPRASRRSRLGLVLTGSKDSQDRAACPRV
jgi:general secretion pathway protein M